MQLFQHPGSELQMPFKTQVSFCVPQIDTPDQRWFPSFLLLLYELFPFFPPVPVPASTPLVPVVSVKKCLPQASLLLSPLSAACWSWLWHLWRQTQAEGVAQAGGGSCGERALFPSPWDDPQYQRTEQYSNWSTAERATGACVDEDVEMN